MRGYELIAATMLAAAQPAGEPAASFPCDKLPEGALLFEGVGAPTGPAATAAVALKKGARLTRHTYPLATRWMTLDDNVLATDGGKFPPIYFRPVWAEGQRRLCTSTVRDNVFGTPRSDGTYLLRCLVDQDGDGRFESSRAFLELVSYNLRTGKTGKPSGGIAPTRPLPKPVGLVEGGAGGERGPAWTPRVVEDLRVIEMTEAEVTLASRGFVQRGAGAGGSLSGKGVGETFTLPLREGRWSGPDGLELVLSRKGKAWLASPAGSPRSGARLQCGGGAVQTGDEITLMTEASMNVLSSRPVPPR